MAFSPSIEQCLWTLQHSSSLIDLCLKASSWCLKEPFQKQPERSEMAEIRTKVLGEFGNAIVVNRSLKNLDFSHNPGVRNLGKIMTRILSIHPQLADVNLSHNSMGNENAQIIGNILAQCSLRSLNLSHNDIADGVYSIALALFVNDSLMCLDLSHNLLGKIPRRICNENLSRLSLFSDALKNNSSLKQLNLSNNWIGNEIKFISEALKINSSLQTLDISNNGLFPEEGKTIAEALKVNRSLENLKMGNSRRREGEEYRTHKCEDEDGGKTFGEALTTNITLKRLSLKYFGIFQKGVQAILDSLSQNQTLLKMNLSGNYLWTSHDPQSHQLTISTQEQVPSFKALASNQSLRVLNLGYCTLQSDLSENEKWQPFINSFLENKGIKKLNLAGNEIYAIGAELLSEILKISMVLQSLNLSDNFLGLRGVIDDQKRIHYAEVISISLPLRTDIKSRKRQTSVEMKGQHIIGIQFISAALKVNFHLVSLNLAGNFIEANGMKVLADGLQDNRTLQVLNISRNWSCDEGAKAVAHALQINETLRELIFEENFIQDAGAHDLAQVLSKNVLRVLKIGRNCIRDKGFECLAVGLQKNKSLTNLEISHNLMQDRGLMAIAKALFINRGISKVNLNGNDLISERARDSFVTIIKRHKTLVVDWTAIENQMNKILFERDLLQQRARL